MVCNHSVVSKGKCYFCNEPVSLPNQVIESNLIKSEPSVKDQALPSDIKTKHTGFVRMPETNPGPKEYVVAMYNRQTDLTVVMAHGFAAECTLLDEDATLFDFEKCPPSYGIWVWEGYPEPVGIGDDFDHWKFSSGKWRAPNVNEWGHIFDGRNPWE